MVSVLWNKTRRELWERKLSLLLLVGIAAAGVSLMVGMLGVILDLDRARSKFYQEQRLADFSLSLKRAPSWALARVAKIPNVRRLEGRISLPIRLSLAGQTQEMAGTALSLAPSSEQPLSDVLLTAGMRTSMRDGDAVINAAFARAHHLKLGDRVTALILDRQWTFRLVGFARSPEYVYVLPPGSFVPDPSLAPVLFVPRRFLQLTANLESAFNEIIGQLEDKRPAAVRATLQRMEEQLTEFGVTYVTPQSEQVSVKFLDNEFSELRSHATIVPAICLGAVAFVLHVVMGRLVAQSRGVIGTLRAIGYKRTQVIFHFLSHSLVVGLLGGLLGSALGLWLQAGMMSLYRQFFELPDMTVHLYPQLVLLGVGVSLLFAGLGTVASVRNAASLEPATAMHPPPPEKVGKILPEYWPGLWIRIPFRGKMILRSVFRNPMRTLTTLGVIAMATGLLFQSICVRSSLAAMVDNEFVDTAHQDLTVSLSDPVEAGCLHEVQRMGVSLVEGQLNVPCLLRYGAVERRLSITGLDPGSVLYTPRTSDGAALTIPTQGLVLTRKLAEILDASLGDRLHIAPLIGLRRAVEAPVVSIVDSWVGLSAYADRRYLSRLVGEAEVVNSLLISTWHGRGSPQLVSALQQRPLVLGVEQRLDTRARLNELMQRSIGMSLWISLGFTGMLALASVLNTALVAIQEREREIGTFRVLGYSPEEVSSIFVGESLLVNGVGVLLGLPCGVALLHLVLQAYNTELFRLPLIIPALAGPQTVLIMATFVGLAQVAVIRMVASLHWLDVFKVRE